MERKVPCRPLPGELSALDKITTLHFRKSAIPAAGDSISKVLPETSPSMIRSQSLLQGVLGKDGVGLGSPQDFLSGSKASLLGFGAQIATAAHSTSISSSSAMLTASSGFTIPAGTASHAAAPALLSFNKYSKVGACTALVLNGPDRGQLEPCQVHIDTWRGVVAFSQMLWLRAKQVFAYMLVPLSVRGLC